MDNLDRLKESKNVDQRIRGFIQRRRFIKHCVSDCWFETVAKRSRFLPELIEGDILLKTSVPQRWTQCSKSPLYWFDESHGCSVRVIYQDQDGEKGSEPSTFPR